MNRQYYGSQNKVDFRRPNRSFTNTVVSRSSHEDTQNFRMGHNTDESSPVQESDSEKSGNPPRRRIALACSRCRKRKIKCSGDLGHGQGCQNCKNAGSDSSACQFLRVNSTTAVYAPPAIPVTWTYGQASNSVSSTSGASQHGSSLGQITSGMMPAVSYAGSAHPSRVPSFGGPSISPYTTGPARQAPTSIYGGTFSDDLCDPFYNMQPIQYPSSLQEAQVPLTSFAASDTGRTWTPITPSSRSSYNGSSLDPESSLRYGQLGFPHTNSSALNNAATEGSSLFPGMSALAGSLPPSSVDRTLPNPNTKRASLISTNGLNQGTLGETSPLGLPPNLNYKSTAPWGSISGSSSIGPASSSSTSISTVSTTVPSSNKPSASPRGSQDAASYGYIPLSRSPPSSLTTARAPEYDSAINLPTSSASMENHMGLTDSAFHGGFSSEDMLPSHSSSSSLYSYSICGGTKSGSLGDSMASEGSLINGDQYTRLRQPQPQHANAFDTLRADTIDTGLHGPHRASISSSIRRF